MTITQMLGQSGILTLLGMGVVFGIIIILILCMKLLHAVLHALKLDVDKKEDLPVASTPAPAAEDDGAIVAAIAAAVHDKVLKS